MERDPLATLRRALAAFEDLIFPLSCGGCGRRGIWLCESCRRELRAVPLPICQRCGRPLRAPAASCAVCRGWPSALERVRGAYVFEGPLRQSIHRFKYQGEHARAPGLAQLLVQPARELAIDFVLISPVPLHPKRRRQRGFDQARLLSRALGRELDIASARGLHRVRQTRPQVGLDFNGRQENVREAFRWEGEPLEGAAVLLIDDVITTGATMAAAAAALQAAGAARVAGLALGRDI